MLAPIGPTLDTTYALQLKDEDGWHFTSQAEYTDADNCRTQAAEMYGGAFAASDQHRVVKIQRLVLD
jgi:hypothetical protein